VNRLRGLLLSIFPGLEQAFDYTNRSPLVLLTGFQAPAAIRVAGVEGVAAFLGTAVRGASAGIAVSAMLYLVIDVMAGPALMVAFRVPPTVVVDPSAQTTNPVRPTRCPSHAAASGPWA
jgi:hypothetical protein